MLAAALVAYAAGLALAPRQGQVIEPVAVRATEVFSPAQLARGRDFRGPQTALGIGALVAQVALLAFWAARPPRWMAGPRRRTLTAAVGGAALSVGPAAASLPFGAASRQRAVDAGLSTRSWLGWLADQLLSAAVGAVFAAVLAVVALALIRRLPRMWWLPGSGLAVLAAAAFVFAGPVVLDPLFNRFEPLAPGPVRSDVLRLAEAAGVRVGEVYVMDASRRTTGANAYVAGLGNSKRVVIYDNVIRDFPPAEIRSIVAHELGHQRHGDLPRGLLYIAIVAPYAVLAVALLSARLAGARRGTPAGLPALALALILLTTGATWISNGLSRRVEARADAFALRATRDPRAFVALQQRLVLRNIGDPDPPKVEQVLLATHPTALERIGMARRFADLTGP